MFENFKMVLIYLKLTVGISAEVNTAILEAVKFQD